MDIEIKHPLRNRLLRYTVELVFGLSIAGALVLLPWQLGVVALVGVGSAYVLTQEAL